jgi:hypothetical protein
MSCWSTTYTVPGASVALSSRLEAVVMVATGNALGCPRLGRGGVEIPAAGAP